MALVGRYGSDLVIRLCGYVNLLHRRFWRYISLLEISRDFTHPEATFCHNAVDDPTLVKSSIITVVECKHALSILDAQTRRKSPHRLNSLL